MTLKAIIHSAEEGGFWAEVPALPGCVTQAKTMDELKANLHEAVELWLSVDDEVTESNVGDKVLELTVGSRFPGRNLFACFKSGDGCSNASMGTIIFSSRQAIWSASSFQFTVINR